MAQQDCHTIVLVGARDPYKSALLKDILRHFNARGASKVIAFSDAAATSVSIERLNAIWEDQEKLAILKRMGKIPLDADIRLLCVFDAYDRKIQLSRVLQKMFLNGRHVQMTVVVTVQSLTDLPAGLRANTDVFFFQKEDDVKSLRRFCNSFRLNFGEFRRAFDYCTCRTLGSLVVRFNVLRTLEDEKHLFFYRA